MTPVFATHVGPAFLLPFNAMTIEMNIDASPVIKMAVLTGERTTSMPAMANRAKPPRLSLLYCQRQ